MPSGGLFHDDEDDTEDEPWFALGDDFGEDDEVPRINDAEWLERWQRAAADPAIVRILLDTAEVQAALAARLRHDPEAEGATARLALEEAGSAMWLAGDAGARDRIVLYAEGQRAAESERDQVALWALRRLQSGGDPSVMPLPDLRRFLGRARRLGPDPDDGHAALLTGPVGDELDQALAEWQALAVHVADSHRLVRAAILHQAWRRIGLSGVEDPVTPAVVASRIAGLEGLPAAPWCGALRRLRSLNRPGGEVARLSAMLEAFRAGANEAQMMVERLATWRQRAIRASTTKAMRAVVAATAAAPVTSTNAIASATGMTPQAINGAARILRADGLIQEATGQSRFRLWQAALS